MIMALMEIRDEIKEARRKGLEEGIRQGRKQYQAELAAQGFDIPEQEPQEVADTRFAAPAEPESDPYNVPFEFLHCHLPAGDEECRVTPLGVFSVATGKQIFAFKRTSDGVIMLSLDEDSTPQ